MSSLLGGKLIYWKKNGLNKIAYTTRGKSVCFGKDVRCLFRLRNPNALPIHCKISMGKLDKVQIINYSVDHPVVVNAKPVTRKQFLKSGDTIEVFNHKLQWEFSIPETLGKCLTPDVSRVKDRRRIWKSEPGRKTKLRRMGPDMTVSVFTEIRDKMRCQSVERDTTRAHCSAEEVTIVDNLTSNTAIEASKSVYGTPMEGSTLKSPKIRESVNLIDLNTPAAVRVDTPEIFKTPMKFPAMTRSMKTPSSVAPVSVDFGGLPQSTPIEVKRLEIPEENESIITIEDSDEMTLEDSVKFIPATPQRVLRSASKSAVGSVTPAKTPKTEKRTPATPRSTVRLSRRPVTSARKTRTGQSTLSKLNCSDTTGEKTVSMVSEDPSLMTMENLANITDKENISTPTERGVTRRAVTSDRISKVRRSPLDNLSNNVTRKKLLFAMQPKTPNLKGVRELLKTPKENSDDLRRVGGVKEIFNVVKSPVNDLTNVVGVRKLFRTPGKEKRDVLEVFPGVKNLLKTPKDSNKLENVVGVKELMKTPPNQDDSVDLRGVKDVLREKPEETSIRFAGIRELMKSPDAQEASVDLRGVRELMKESEIDLSINLRGVKDLLRESPDAEMSVNLVGVKELLKEGPKDDVSINYAGVRDLMKPSTSHDMSYQMTGVRELLKEPVNTDDLSHDLTDLGALYSIPEEEVAVQKDSETPPKPSSSSSSEVKVIELDASMDDLFDSLKGRTSMPSVKHTYSRKESPKKQKKSPPEVDIDRQGIQEWIDSIVSTTTTEATTPRRANNTLQVLSDKYSNVTPNESVVEDTEDVGGVREISLRKQAIVQSMALSVIDLSLDLGEGVTSTPMNPRRRKAQEENNTPSDDSMLRRVLRNRKKDVNYSEKSLKVTGSVERAESTTSEKSRGGRMVGKIVQFAVPSSPTVETKKRGARKVAKTAAKASQTAAPDSPDRPKRAKKSTVKLLENEESVKASPRRGRPAKKPVQEEIQSPGRDDEEMKETETPDRPKRAKKATVKLLENEESVKASPRRGRPAKKPVQEEIQSPGRDDEEMKETETPDRPKRAKKATVKLLENEESVKASPRRGRPAKKPVQEEIQSPGRDDEEMKETETPDRPKRAKKATVKLLENEESVKASPRRGRPAKKLPDVEDQTAESAALAKRLRKATVELVRLEESPEAVVKPSSRRRRLAKKPAEDRVSEETTETPDRPKRTKKVTLKVLENEETAKASPRRGRAKKTAGEEEETEDKTSPKVDSTVEIEEPKVKSRGRPRKVKEAIDSTVAKQKNKKKDEEEKIKSEEVIEPQKMTLRPRKAK
ncbi:neurofilament heavy polypeptide-like [Phlebotomus argentipes]|uniref:neurofilament heavy polypeptide-like n=1 Tax=Phlebotomus argentipes TaxID=94469 RepID=UPI0028934A86|nr:neurofilament heavy polypeptide-like [Phlebotomus argentipes]